MRKLAVLIFMSAIFTFIAVSLSTSLAKKETFTENKVYNCQCHEEPWKYRAHYETSCNLCHVSDILKTHKDDYKDCFRCHERSLLANHMPKGCELCHGRPEYTHEKFEERWR
ncbi:MAG: hypothetical protein NZ895_03915 [Archaeoglobaceae archaeon]|nr:hypothetical protein [Archaeoglobaceae archaeon]MCX8152455.1 hypothetical protein [Archaeoglobaceae archaeon]MDW8013795.1 hypothetical protein [Archaeoglobaceae archaeon]